MPKTFALLPLYTGKNDLTGPSSASMALYRIEMHLCPDGDECLTVFTLLPAIPVALRTPGWKDTQDCSGPSRAPLPISARRATVLQMWAGPRFQGWVFIFKVKVKLTEGGQVSPEGKSKAAWSPSVVKGGQPRVAFYC